MNAPHPLFLIHTLLHSLSHYFRHNQQLCPVFLLVVWIQQSMFDCVLLVLFLGELLFASVTVA